MNSPKHFITCSRGPLTQDEKNDARRLPYGEVYIRMCALGPGGHFITTAELRRITRSSNRDDVTNILYKLSRMHDGTKFLRYIGAERYGKTQREKIIVHVADLSEFNTEGLPEQPDIENTGRVLTRFLNEFKERMKMRGDVNWNATGKEVSLAKRILSMAGGFEAALDFMTFYFKMPPEHRGDDLSFTFFYRAIPRIISIRDNERIEAFEMAAGERRAAARSRIPTEEETADFLRRADEQIAKNKENPSKPRRRVRWDEEDDEL